MKNRIYNNLSIENLTKTDWFNQFDDAQKIIIKTGLKHNLNVSVYAKKHFNSNQMIQIREGLKDNLDVEKFAKPELDWKEMREIRTKLLVEAGTL